jgi:fatty-acyl-CoA synthase
MIKSLAPELSQCKPGNLISQKLPDLSTVIVIGNDVQEEGVYPFSWLEAQACTLENVRMRLDPITQSLSPQDPINIQFTSGTTGAPKGATLTHMNIVNNARFVVERMNFSAKDRLCLPVPLYHCFGMVMGTLGCVTVGACIILPGASFDAAEALTAIEEENCTALYAVPTMYVAMLEHPAFSDFNLSSLRTGVMAGAPCPIEIMKKVFEQLNMSEITICYGMTETSPVSFQSQVDDPIEKRVATVGRIHPHVEVKIVDEKGRIVLVGETGELWTKGYSVMQGYWQERRRTEEAIVEDGWMRTGDLAVLDDEGYCSIVGRLKDMIIRGGENIYPREIEEFLYKHTAVNMAQVFGVPDEKFGEEVCAWIVPQLGAVLSEEDVLHFCKGQIAHYKIPKYIRIVEEMPMTVTGKPQKFIMQQLMLDELKLALPSAAV